ncbi:pyridoxamine 5'-phosphate oxidase family protein [Ideonella oryzae]|uniref:Pyridoxamine 5'-phosphate oxidase family protein n=1 Tax=Ideonella oryzae TaxID=2937441 RepID=A0ABT1BKN8_9BURK|nr:pyridoxamine 5'-phosphate oxidase family protein [Ideonella oryzae]MCO5976459.1 pyridoxamine 5'-phosphate oxidase family protein [Ideonella oryzae]
MTEDVAPTQAITLGESILTLMARPISVIVGSSDAAGQPHLIRAVGFAWDADRARVSVYVPEHGREPVLEDLRRRGWVAVVLSEPSTHASVQLKGRDALVEPATAEDLAHVAQGVEHFADELEGIGFSRELAHALKSTQAAPVWAVRFTPTQAWEQTPGPRAGTRLDPAGGAA